MKKIFSIFMILTLCANPAIAAKRGYTIDRREYVTNSELKQAPFSSVVALQDKWGDTYCTATLTTDGIVVTAKHCVVDGGPARLLLASKGQMLKYDLLERSSADIYDDNGRYINAEQDFAFMGVVGDVPDGGVELFTISSLPGLESMVVGYGALRILSDDEIKTIRHEYAKWLKKNRILRPAGHSRADKDGVDLYARGATGSEFVKDIRAGKIPGVDKKIFSDDSGRLKKSYCVVNGLGGEMGCQTWGGNSGGPVFTKMGDTWVLFGEHTSSNPVISSSDSYHIQGAGFVPVSIFGFGVAYDEFLWRIKDKRAQTAD